MDAIFTALYNGESLTQAQSQTLFDHIIRGEMDPIQLASALTALKIKGETPEEIAGAASALVENAKDFPRPSYDFADIVGTGGDGANTINISTTAAFIAAACGAKVAKHGNRGVSSKSGSSDLLDAFGIDLTMSPDTARQALDDLGLCFLFAPHYHGGVKHAMPVRQALATRTIFNLLGPLINPARPNLELMGVYDEALVEPIAKTMAAMGFEHALVVHGSGLDEVAVHGSTHVAEVKNGHVRSFTLTPQDFGLETYRLKDLEGGSPEENRAHTQAILQGQGQPAHQAAVAANVALLLTLFGQPDLKANTQKALKAMADGAGYAVMQALAQRGHA
ncbi:Bifunctional protein TrpGD [Vibrio stylophorae]|uniref:Anthranilate phosphoribosyltransferase n=1 Tax=Vibrio stylophorae TaxID=659351 RepID=A0ABN8DRN4_9VIBR|nr:anthranilate phosphoribosyltransferase [Vibrio stylophorae]CAH0532983.1 Bifunctional protein TrpGD [Vibrio stylophorae]